MAEPLDLELRERALRIYTELGASEAARQTGVQRATISQWAKRAGVTSDAPNTARAMQEAAQLSMQQRRLRLAEDLLADAERLRAQLWEPAASHHWGQDVEMDERSGRPVSSRPVMATETIAKPLFGDQKQIMLAVAIAVDKSQLLSGEATSRPEQLEPEQARERLAQVLGRHQLRVVRDAG